ncbi:MAG TPA: MarR family transcriptional regulator [Bacteroidetes bacterium]|nr:MarR family transcriptional regulator [Bacteroidota bacterium]HEX03763.1 MarR family transcriptional regulator [Bacteroidota bacterium]
MRKEHSEFLGFWIHRLRTAIQTLLDQHVSELGVSASEALLMTVLSFQGSSSLVEIAGIMGLTHPSVLRTIDSLEKRNLVKRTPHPNDRRIKLVTFTDEGRALEEKINQMLYEVNQIAVKGMNEEELDQFFSLIHRAIVNTGGDKHMPPLQAIPPSRHSVEDTGSQLNSERKGRL